jgi:nicotinamide riboside kinase
MTRLRLVVLGTHSTGKTSLARELSSELNIPYVEGDIVKKIVRDKFHKKSPLELTLAEYWKMEKHHYTHQLTDATNHSDFVSDGGFILDAVYLAVTFKLHKDPAYSAFANLCVDKTKELYSHIIYLPLEIPLEDDKFRPRDLVYRFDIDKFLVEVLNQNKISYLPARGSIKQRVGQVLDYISKNQ